MTQALEYISTRDPGAPVTLSEAIVRGLAPDGGLYVPQHLPALDTAALAGLSRLPDLARRSLDGFFRGDRLHGELGAIADAALDFPAPTTPVAASPDPLYVLELFHGPTAAFKDSAVTSPHPRITSRRASRSFCRTAPIRQTPGSIRTRH